jgi:putative tryptophan/tyrosine transport system substrate-binding protein
MKKKIRNKKIIIISITAILICTGAAAYFFLNKKNSANSGQVTHKIGILYSLDAFDSTIDGLKIKMAELGYQEGKDISYDMQKVQMSDSDTIQRNLQKFADEKVDLIFVFPTELIDSTLKVSEKTGIPVLFANSDINKRPEGNITGITHSVSEVTILRFETLEKMLPSARKIIVPYQKGSSISETDLAVLRPAAKTANVSLLEIPIDDPLNLSYLSSKLSKEDAVFFLPDPIAGDMDIRKVIDDFSEKVGMPVIGFLDQASDRSFFSLAWDNIETGKQAGLIANQILKGTRASDIPLSRAHVYLQINLKVAQKLGIKVSDEMLSQADEAIK